MTARPAVVVMAKAPWPGTVKTRLTALLGEAGCARLASVLLARAAATAREVCPSGTFVALHPPAAIAEFASRLPGHQVFAQRGRHLGERLAAAAEEVFCAGYGPLVVIGTDVPLLVPADLHRAFEVLGTRCDVVFGPAFDGGYYLVGLARPLPVVFDITPGLWGGPDVLGASLDRARTARLSVGLLTPLPDLDTPSDVRAALDEPTLPAEVREALRAPTPLASVREESR